MTPNRRKFLKAVGATSTIGLAGCTGGNSSGNSGGDTGGNSSGNSGGDTGGNSSGNSDSSQNGVEWPPDRNNIEIITPEGPGAAPYIQSSLYAQALPKYLEGIKTANVTAQTGAGGLTSLNTAWNAKPDGGTIVISGATGLVANELFLKDQLEYKALKFNPIAFSQTKMRSISVSFHSTEIEEHFQWSWDEFIERAPDFTIPILSPRHETVALMIEKIDPRLQQGDLNLVNVAGGDEARAGIARGDFDVYFGGFAPQYLPPRSEEYYKTQFVVQDPNRYPDICKPVIDLTDGAADGKFVTQTPLAEASLEDTEAMVDLTFGGDVFLGPPDMPDSIYKRLVDGFAQAQDDSELEAGVKKSLGNPEFTNSSVHGQGARGIIKTKREVWTKAVDDGTIPENFIQG